MGCENCGQEFERTMISKRFCSESCRKVAERRRRRERLNKDNSPCPWCGGARKGKWVHCSEACSRERRRHRFWYGINSLEERDQLLNKGGGCCEICGTYYGFIGKKGLHIDHKHGEKSARGLLCFSCNTGLGKFYDDPALFSAAIEYLASNEDD